MRTRVLRQYRRLDNTPLEVERLFRKACPNCGCERENFQPRNRTAICCRPACSSEYWGQRHQTRDEMRSLILKEQHGLCAHCSLVIVEFNAMEGPYGTSHPYVLDHIRPIAMGGAMWDREKLQVLCERCNKSKTARDMGKIARWNKYHPEGIEILEDNSRQARLFS